MYRLGILCFCFVLTGACASLAAETQTEPKELSGMSIVGNDEAPKSLYIVPWKSSEIGVETSLNMLLDARDVPVDREVFIRQLDFYQVSITNNSGRTK